MRIRDRLLKDAVQVAKKPQNDVLLGKKLKNRMAEIIRLHRSGYGSVEEIAAKVGNCTSAIELEKECGPLVHALSFAPDGPRKTIFQRTQENFDRWVRFVAEVIEGDSRDE